MATELRKNPISGTIIIVSPVREKSVEQLRRKTSRDWSKVKPEIVSGEKCPFCENHEQETPPEIKAYRKAGSEPNTPGWWVRAVPNKAAAVDSSMAPALEETKIEGPFLTIPAYGFHYVIVEMTDHNGSLTNASWEQVREVLNMWRDLTQLVGSDRDIKYCFLFKNYGPQAGASHVHSHSQLIALPIIPTDVMNELRGAKNYIDDNRECFYCREIEWELQVEERIVVKTDNFVAWCLYTGRTPYQVVISPKEHQSFFANISTYTPQGKPGSDYLTEFSGLLRQVLKKISILLNDPDYVFYLHTAPSNQPVLNYYHWHLQIEPITEAVVAGFEKGSGVYINPRSPESAANDLREVAIS